MQVSIENTSTLGRRMTVGIPAETVQLTIRSELNTLAKNSTRKGFRPGKVHKSLLGDEAKHKAIQKLVNSTLADALKAHDLKPAGMPTPEKIDSAPDNSLEYRVIFEIYPEINLCEFSYLEVEKPEIVVSKEDVSVYLEKLKSQFANWIEIPGNAQKGDRLTVNYTSTLNGKNYEHNSGEAVVVELGSAGFIAGFEEGLLGAKANDVIELDLRFPHDWRLENLRDKEVHFIINVEKVEEKQEAVLDEEFARKIGALNHEENTIREKVQQELEAQIKQKIEATLKENLYNALLAAHAFEVPEVLIEQQKHELHEALHRNQGNEAQPSCHHEGLDTEARKRVALGLIMSEIIKHANITLDQKRVQAKIAEIGESFSNAAFVESMYYESEKLLNSLQSAVLMEQAFDHVIEHVKLKPCKYTFNDFVNA